MSTSMLILIILIILFVAAMPSWPYSRGWGMWPGGIVGVLLLVVLILVLTGNL